MLEGLDDGALWWTLSNIQLSPTFLWRHPRALGRYLAHISMSSRRLYSKGRVLGHKRSKRNSRPNTSLLQIEGVANKDDAQFYLGKVRKCECASTRDSTQQRIL